MVMMVVNKHVYTIKYVIDAYCIFLQHGKVFKKAEIGSQTAHRSLK